LHTLNTDDKFLDKWGVINQARTNGKIPIKRAIAVGKGSFSMAITLFIGQFNNILAMES
jgi:hypothetical protein